MVGGIGVLMSAVGVVNGRPGLVIPIGGNIKMIRKWAKDTVDATAEERRKNELDPLGDPSFGLFFDIFVDGQWGWAILGRNFQVLFVTLTHPLTGRGYTVHSAILDVKATCDYVAALRSFAQELLEVLKTFDADGDNVRFHCDEENAVITALAELIGGHIVLCRFHKAQNFERHLKVAFNKKRFVSFIFVTAVLSDQSCLALSGKAFTVSVRLALHHEFHSFFRTWLSESASFADADNKLVDESNLYAARGTLLAAKPLLFATLRVRLIFCHLCLGFSHTTQEAMIKDNAGEVVSNEHVYDLIDRVCLNAGDVFAYLEGNVLNVADRCFRYALGDKVFDEMGTNNVSEAQNSRFDRFVGSSIHVGSVAELVNACIAYLSSAANLYLALGASAAQRPREKTKNDPSVRMPPLTLGRMLSNQRKLKNKEQPAVWEGDGLDEFEEM